MDRHLDLAGEWRAHVSEPDLVKTFADPAFDDSTWAEVRLPHHWRTETGFTETDGPLLYRRPLTVDADPDRRWFVEFDGMRPHQVHLEGGDASSDSYCFSSVRHAD